MGLSETVVAAMIGAIATVSTALFQLFTAFKARKADVKPRRGTTMRSILAVLALMVASAGGGFLYSQLLQQRDAEDIRAMRQELRDLRDLTASNLHEQQQQVADSAKIEAAPTEPLALTASISDSPAGAVESIVYVPACRSRVSAGEAMVACQETDAQRIALCGSVPAYAKVEQIRLFAQPDAVQHPWEQHSVALESDIGGARFTGRSFEYAQAADTRAVCVNFMHWSSEHPYIARILVQFEHEAGVQPSTDSAPVIPMTAAMAASESTR